MNRLITEDERRQLLAHGQARARGEAIYPLPVARLFTRTRISSGCWPRSILSMAIRPGD